MTGKAKRSQLNPIYRAQWDQKKTLNQNFEALGLKVSLKPNLKHTTEGKTLMKSARGLGRGDGNFTSEFSQQQIDKVHSEREKQPSFLKSERKFNDLNDLFPGQFKSKDEIEEYPSEPKLRGDDLQIVMRLVKKYKDDVDTMFKDIKLNYMQWSKSILKK
eukprot:CAMPEP_0168628166 /NCGR_PEP_ID=MMETSP0449_2-20121227/11694_1 /TAXON_ID=1082188 /ORGANISM="Strombidium rassoulzadegani, Strain ras09" /LENGTH=159 /DNA_ID=CAMNT_0008670557 /DNA_START=56 /DNA_END=532 /DNA_ORIENTATION=-